MTRRTAVLVVSLASAQVLGAPVAREGDGARRERLNAMETQAPPHGVFRGLTEWSGIDAIKDTDLAGHVTLVVTVDAQQPDSLRITRDLARLARAHDDLTILAVHPKEGWSRFALLVKAGTVRIPAACDAGGTFAAAFEPDDAPDLYLFDRAGHLRYADFAEASLEGAVEELLAETPEHAGGEAERRAEQIAAGESPFTSEPEVVEVDPAELTAAMLSPSVYAEADWPRTNANPGANDYQGKKLPALGHETWISEKDREPADHVLVLDFWATWCGPCKAAMPKLTGLQSAHREDLMVLAIGGQRESEGTVREFVKEEGEHYYHLFDADQTIYRQLRPQGIPHVVVVSTDGVVRWQGNPHDDSFVAAVKQTIKADPLIRAKRGRMDVSEGVLATPEEVAEVVADADYGWPAHNARLSADDHQGEELKNPLLRTRFIDGKDRPDTDGKVVVLDFWATWCGPCKKASPGLDALQQKFGSDVVIVGVSGQSEDQGTVERYLASHKVSYRHAFSPDQRAFNYLGVRGIPHVVVLSSDSVIRWQGNPLDSQLESVIARTIEADKKRLAAIASASKP
ncbi:MAG: TlpA disulfide reductase family protein [Phycisphaerales bacterium]